MYIFDALLDGDKMMMATDCGVFELDDKKKREYIQKAKCVTKCLCKTPTTTCFAKHDLDHGE